MKNRKRIKRRIINLIMPALVFGSLTGVMTASVVMIYKFCAGKIIHISESAYGFMRANLWAVLPALAVVAAAAYLYKAVLTKYMKTSVKAIPNYLLCKPLFRIDAGRADVIDIMPLIRAYLHFRFGNP